MATIFTEGFDKYGPACATIGTANLSSKDVSTLLTQREWTSVFTGGLSSGIFTILPGLSETGFALGLVNQFSPVLSKTLPASYGRIIGGFRFLSTLAASAGCAFYDSANPQVTITVDFLTGLITIFGGDINGTLLGQSLVSVSANTIHYLEFDITFGTGILGSFQVWLDGSTAIAGTGTTQQLSCLPSANVFQLNSGSAGAGNPLGLMAYDDLYLFDSTGSTNNAVLLANQRIETQFPIADHQKQFTNNGNVIGAPYSNQGPQGAADTPGANQLYLRPFTPIVDCTIIDIGFIPSSLGTNAIAKFRGVIYSDTAGAPDSLMSTGSQVVGSLAGVPLIGPLNTPQALTAGTQYWIGFIGDTAVQVALENTATAQGRKAVNTYSAGAPGSAPAMTPNQPSWTIFGLCDGAVVNWPSENLNPPIGAFSSIISSTANDEDLYLFPALSTDVITVYTMAVKAHASVVATGTRTLDVRTKSGSTDSAGSLSGFVPNTSGTWYGSYFDLDPNGSVPWVPATVTASFSGPKVAS